LDARNPDDLDKMKSFVRQSVKAGAEGVGFGMNYMGPSSIHIGGGERASWGGSEWIGSELKSGVKERESFNKSGGIKAWIEERKKKIEESNKPTTSNVSAQDVYNPELRKPIEARGITSIGRDSPTAVPVQTVPQTVPEGQTPQQGQTGSPAITGPTPDNKQVQPQYKVPDQTQVVPQEQTKAPSSTQTPVDTENKEQAKGYAGGGEIPTQELRPGENAYVVSQKGEVVAQMNTKREIARTNPDSGKAEIVPMTRTPSETIPQNTKQRQDNQEQRAEQTNKNQETTVKQNAPTPSQAESNPNLRNMHEYNMSVGIPQSPSHQRAMMNSTSFGNPINHYGMKSTTTTIV
jgi:hypothetical protein